MQVLASRLSLSLAGLSYRGFIGAGQRAARFIFLDKLQVEQDYEETS